MLQEYCRSGYEFVGGDFFRLVFSRYNMRVIQVDYLLRGTYSDRYRFIVAREGLISENQFVILRSIIICSQQ